MNELRVYVKIICLVYLYALCSIMHLILIYFLLINSFNGLSYSSTNGIFDLSYPVNNLTLDWAGDKFAINITNESVEKGNISYWYQVDTIWTPTHLGTHLDAPCHFARNAWCVSDIPIERLYMRPGYVIDISHKIEASANPNYALTCEDVKDWFKSIGLVRSGAVILIRTNWSKHWPDRKKYFGIKGAKLDSFNFPGISVDAIKTLIDLGIDFYGIGIESPSVDNGPSEDFATHTLLASHNIYNLENVGPLIRQLPRDNFLITSLPVRIDSASGSPVRIVAQLSNSSNDQLGPFIVILMTVLIIAISYYRNNYYNNNNYNDDY